MASRFLPCKKVEYSFFDCSKKKIKLLGIYTVEKEQGVDYFYDDGALLRQFTELISSSAIVRVGGSQRSFW